MNDDNENSQSQLSSRIMKVLRITHVNDQISLSMLVYRCRRNQYENYCFSRSDKAEKSIIYIANVTKQLLHKHDCRHNKHAIVNYCFSIKWPETTT